MAESQSVSMDEFRKLVNRVGLNLPEAELQELKPLYDYYADEVAALHELDLDAEDLALAFSADWEPLLQDGEVRQ